MLIHSHMDMSIFLLKYIIIIITLITNVIAIINNNKFTEAVHITLEYILDNSNIINN